MKKHWLIIAIPLVLVACGGGSDSETAGADRPRPKSMVPDPVADDGKGIGEIKEVSLNAPLRAAMVERGKAISEMKCAACHKMNDQRVVGPGWKGITERRKPEWIMNMVTNVDVMLAEDPTAQALLEECLTRMPNQNLSIGDARDVLEYMYANDNHPIEE